MSGLTGAGRGDRRCGRAASAETASTGRGTRVVLGAVGAGGGDHPPGAVPRAGPVAPHPLRPDRGRPMTATRRRLLVYSAPVVVIVLLFAVKLISAVLAGNAAVSHFAESDGAALERDAGVLRIVNIIEPARAPFAAGTAAALQGRLDDADREFSLALARTDQRDSCSVRVNLALVRESQGDNAAATFDGAQPAVDHYLAAKRVLEQAPADCLAAHTDTTARLDSKIAAVATPPPPPAPRPRYRRRRRCRRHRPRAVCRPPIRATGSTRGRGTRWSGCAGFCRTRRADAPSAPHTGLLAGLRIPSAHESSDGDHRRRRRYGCRDGQDRRAGQPGAAVRRPAGPAGRRGRRRC